MQSGLFQEIHEDHEELKQIIEKLENTSSRSARNRESLFGKLKEELIPHMKAEERVFYPALAEEKSAREKALEALEEHHVAEMLFKELDKMPKGEERWKAKLMVFKEVVSHHIKEEESTVFEKARSVFDEDQLEMLHENFQKNKKSLLERLKKQKAA